MIPVRGAPRLAAVALGCQLLLGLLLPVFLGAQDLEPRFLSPGPVGMNFVVAGYAYSRGNVLLDQALPLQDTDARLHAITLGYARLVNVFGLTGRITAAVPLAHGTWHGTLEGVDTSTTRKGFGDPLVGFAVDFVGAHARSGAEFAASKPSSTIIGFSLKAKIPIGQYDDSKFFNLSAGRWMISPRLGLAQYVGRFAFEGYLSGWFFTTNRDFWGGNTVAQNPIAAYQLHASYLFRRGFWGAVSFGQVFGGATTVNGVANDDAQRASRLGATLTVPVNRAHSVKAVYTAGVSARVGADFDTIVIAWQYRWGGTGPTAR